MWLFNACISVWKLQNSKHFNLAQKSSRYLECNKSYDGLHPGTVVQNSCQIPVGAQGFVGSPSHLGCMMIYSNHQICPALNSKQYWSNKQAVPLLGCCSDAPGSPGNHLVISGDRTFFQSNFGFEIKFKSDRKKLLHICNTLWPNIRHLNTLFLSGLGINSASLPSHIESAIFFLIKSLNFTVFFSFGHKFSSQHQ